MSQVRLRSKLWHYTISNMFLLAGADASPDVKKTLRRFLFDKMRKSNPNLRTPPSATVSVPQ